MTDASAGLSNDLLRGADEIALFIFGERSMRRRVYHLVSSSRMPVFKLGAMICARRSVLLEWIAMQEGWRPRRSVEDAPA